MAEDSKLATSLRQAKTQPMFFAFVAKGTSDGVLIVSKRKIPIKEINEAKAACGGKTVFKGRCVGEGGGLVFEVAKEPPSTLAKQIKTVANRDAGMTLKVETRVAEDLEEGEGEETASETDAGAEAPTTSAAPPAPPAPPPPAPTTPVDDAGASRFAAHLKTLAVEMQKIDAGGQAKANEAKQKIGEANTLYRKKEYEQANALLDQADKLVQQALSHDVPPPPLHENAGDAAHFAAHLKALAPELQKPELQNSPQIKEAKLKVSEANALFRTKEFGQANALLDQAEALVKQASAPSTGKGSNVPPPPPLPPLPPDRKLSAQLKSLSPRITEAMRMFPERKGEIQALKAAVETLVAEMKQDEAQNSLTALKKLLDSLGSVPTELVEGFREEWEKAIASWEAALNTVKGQMEGLKSELAGSDDENLQLIAEYGLQAATEKQLVPLTAALLELGATGPDRLKVAGKRVQNAITAFRQHVESSKIVRVCDENPFGVTVTIKQTLTPGFAALEKGLEVLTKP